MKTAKIKKVLAITALFAMFVQPTAAFAGGIMKASDMQGGNGGNAYGNAGTIYYGNYWQNGSGTDLSGYTKEALQWRVLANNDPTTGDGNGNKGLFLLSDKALYADAFQKDMSTNRWKDSEIRTTLNSTSSDTEVAYEDLGAGFAKDAFNAKEYAAINSTTHKAGGAYTGKDETSAEKIFLLSADEATDPAYGFTTDDTCKAKATDLAKSVKMYENINVSHFNSAGHTYWWLRSPGNSGDTAYYVGHDGGVYGINDVNHDDGSARAALNLDTDKVLFLSAAAGGKSDVAVFGGFNLADYNGSNGYKITLKDSDIATPTNISVTQAKYGKHLNDFAEAAATGGTIDLTSGSTTVSYDTPTVKYQSTAIQNDKANYVSAIVEDNTEGSATKGQYVNYAKISDAVLDTKKVNTDNLADGEYKMYLFAEKTNGDYQTDYASELSAAYTIHKGPETKTKDTLSAAYKDKKLTINLDKGFDLGFENAAYDTNINVGTEGATLTADADGTELNGAINLNGNTKFVNSFIFGGDMNFKTPSTINTATDIKTVGNVNFYLDNAPQGSTIVTMNGGKMDVSAAKVNLYQKADTALYENGKGVTLIDGATGYAGTKAEPVKITALKEGAGLTAFNYNTYLDSDKLIAEYTTGEEPGPGPGPVPGKIVEEAKSLSEGRMATTTALNQANDVVTTQAVMAGVEATNTGTGFQPFAAVGGSHGRYHTGSYVDMNSFNAAVGLAKKLNDNTTIGLLIEGGNGKYTSHNNFGTNEVTADGNVNYFGGGLFAKHEFKQTDKGNFYADGSFRVGHSSQDYDSTTMAPGMTIRYDASGTYFSAHASLGYNWKFSKGQTIDTYARYLWSRQNNDTVTINGEKLDFDAINSRRIRAGFRYNKEINKALKWYGGLAWEYEFSNEAGATAGGIAIAEPDLKGGSGMAELGVKFNPKNSNWKFDAGVQGFTGKRDSIGLNLGAIYEF